MFEINIRGIMAKVMKTITEFFQWKTAQRLHVKNHGGLFRKVKIKTRLIGSFVALSFIPLFITGVMSYSKSSNAIRTKIDTYSVQVIQQASKNIQIETEKLENSATEIAFSPAVQNTLSKYRSMDSVERQEALAELNKLFVSKFSSVKAVKYVQLNLEANPVASYGISPVKPEVIGGYLKNASDKKEGMHWDAAENYLILSTAINSKLNGKVMGGLSAVIDETYLADIYKDISLGKDSRIIIIDVNGAIISAVEKERTLKLFQNVPLAQKIGESENQSNRTFSLNIGKNDYLAAFSKVGTKGWYMVAAIPYSYLNEESKDLGINIAIIGLICLITALLLAYLISTSISNPLDRLVQIMEYARNGDFTKNMSDTSEDEISVVIGHFNFMVSNISKLVSKVYGAAQDVLDGAEKIEASVSRSYIASEQTAVTMQHVAEGATQQAGEVGINVDQMDFLSESINKVGGEMDEVSRVVTGMKELSESALASVRLLNDRMDETNTASVKAVQNVHELSLGIKEIETIVHAIEEISGQTNLLSLNAAIEAARAGEAGKGFSVVAGEIRRLADKSKESSATIHNIIRNIQEKAESTVKEAGQTSATVKQQTDALVQTDKAFKTIFQSMDGISKQIGEICHLVQEVLTSKEKALISIKNISAISEETAATVQEVSASTDEQMTVSQEISDLAKNMNLMSHELYSSIATFRI